ncbi:MAG: hypothetical protein H6719_13870 [Sandaracinaceae bacterium]|nr:hypothetical protein [Sandaracinaceae bacterium]
MAERDDRGLTPFPKTPAMVREAAVALAITTLGAMGCGDTTAPMVPPSDGGAAVDAGDAGPPSPMPARLDAGTDAGGSPPPMPPPFDAGTDAGGPPPPMPPPVDAGTDAGGPPPPMPAPRDAGFDADVIPPMPPPMPPPPMPAP